MFRMKKSDEKTVWWTKVKVSTLGKILMGEKVPAYLVGKARPFHPGEHQEASMHYENESRRMLKRFFCSS